MSKQPCLNCGKESKTMIQLKCEHDLCLDCAEAIKVAEGSGPLDAKFKIACPSCHKNTQTLNIQNLIINDTEKLLFVNMESSELSEQELGQQFGGEKGNISQSKLRKMSYTQRRSSVYSKRRTPDVYKRNQGHQSRASNNRSRAAEILDVKCSTHKQSLMFYCQQEGNVMCMQCMYKHMKEQKNHNVCSLSDALPTIAKTNLDFKAEAKHRMEDIDKNLAICKGNKNRIEQAYEIHEQMIGQQFKELQKLIKKKQQQNREHLQRVFKKKQEQLGDQINQLNYLKSCLKQHYQFNIDSSTSHVYFFNAFQTLKIAMTRYNLSYKQIKKQQFFCFDKYASLDDFSALLERFYRPRQGGRESKNTTARREQPSGPSRASEKGASMKVVKQQFYEEAKKKLQKLNKMEHDHNIVKKKTSRDQYLQNFFIEQVGRQLEHSHRPHGTAAPTHRKSSASQYVERKGQKTLTPTRITPTPTHTKRKK